MTLIGCWSDPVEIVVRAARDVVLTPIPPLPPLNEAPLSHLLRDYIKAKGWSADTYATNTLGQPLPSLWESSIQHRQKRALWKHWARTFQKKEKE